MRRGYGNHSGKICTEFEFTHLRILLGGEGWCIVHILAGFYQENSHCPYPLTVACLMPAPHEGRGCQGAYGHLCRCSGKFHCVEAAGTARGRLCNGIRKKGHILIPLRLWGAGIIAEGRAERTLEGIGGPIPDIHKSLGN